MTPAVGLASRPSSSRALMTSSWSQTGSHRASANARPAQTGGSGHRLPPARSQLHLLQIMEEIEGKGAKIVSLMDNIDTGTATGTMVVGVLAVLAEFERNLLIERCAAGVKIARQRNVRFGRPPKLTPSLIRQVLYHLRLISSGWLAWA